MVLDFLVLSDSEELFLLEGELVCRSEHRFLSLLLSFNDVALDFVVLSDSEELSLLGGGELV